MPATSRMPDAGRSVPGTWVPAPGQSWRRVFPGDERQLRELRRWLADVLPDAPARDDVVSVASELSANAIQHTASGRGGAFAVEVVWQRRPGTVWLAVADGGAPQEPHEVDDPMGEHGRGLILVHGLSARTGTAGDQHSRVVWAEIPWEAVQEAAVAAAHGAVDAPAETDAALAGLTTRFAGVPIWYGRSTQQWWALVRRAGKDELMSASSAADLAEALSKVRDILRPTRPPEQRGAAVRKPAYSENRARRRTPGGTAWAASSATPFEDAVDASGFVAAPVPWDTGSGLDRWAS
jgi:anti-sigma regulatory factor (Ser/Thr protein kinase)